MSGTLNMMGVESPISLRSTESKASGQPGRPPSRSHDRPSYRLFPSVGPTPPQSPAVHRNPINRPPPEPRRRSASLDADARRMIQRQNMPIRQVAVERGRKGSVPDIQPMSTVRESADSPTVPIKYTAPPFIAEDAIYNRSSSAPGDQRYRPRVHMKAPSESRLRSVWTSRPIEQHPQKVKGLGLTLPSSQFAPRQPRQTRPGKQKPNLRINVDHEDRPPPPPPKSPRHSRDPSVASSQSGVSSMHGESPDSATVVTPEGARAVLHDTRYDAMPTPGQPLQAAQASYLQTGGPIRVREVAIPKDRKQSESAVKLPEENAPKPAAVVSKTTAPNIDKPMPSLPTPNKRFSAHVREVQEAERSEKKEKPDSETNRDTIIASTAPSTASTEMTAPTKPSPAPSSQKSEVDAQQFPQPLKSTPKPSLRDGRSPTPDLASRAQSPANHLHTVSASAKVLPILPTEGPPQSRSATPDSTLSRFKSHEPKSIRKDPLETIQDLNKQSEALHVRYSSLRADRVKITTAISHCLRDEKPGSEYANNLLDQHLSLNAINSSMDICFAKLKSLDCRKEEAMQAFIEQMKTQSLAGDTRKSTSIMASLAPPLSAEAGRTTPEMISEPKSLTPELMPTSRFANTAPSIPEPIPEKGKPDDMKESEEETEGSPETTEKRITIIRASSKSSSKTTSSDPPMPSPISSIHDLYATKRIRIKGAKAAKILGLVAQSANGGENGRGITLPDKSPGMPASFKKPIAVEVEIQERPKVETTKKAATTSPSPSTPETAPPKMPKRKPPPTPKHEVKDSVSSSVASSQTESSPEEPEILTPTGSAEDVPFGLKSAKRGMVQTMATMQTIQVFVDDVDILDYYGQVGH